MELHGTEEPAVWGSDTDMLVQQSDCKNKNVIIEQ